MGLGKYIPGALGAICWGMLGIFFTLLERVGHSSISTLSAGLLISAIIMSAYLLIMAPKKLIPTKPLIIYGIIIGLIGIVVLNLAYLEALRLTSVPIAVLLISTAPFFVLGMNLIYHQSRIALTDTITLLIAISGIALGMNIFNSLSFSIAGLFWGLLSGLCFGIYIVLGTKAANENVDNLALLTYTFIIGAIILNIIHPSTGFLRGEWDMLSLIYLMLWVLIANLGGWFFYNWGLKLIPSQHSALLSIFEPISGLLGALIILGDKLSLLQISGILLSITAIGVFIWSNNQKENVSKVTN